MKKITREEMLGSFLCLFFGLGIILFILITPGCNTPGIPPINATFWAGDSAQDSITRSQDHQLIACKDPQFDNYVCLSYADVQMIYKTLLRCKQWSTEVMNSNDIFNFIIRNPEIARGIHPQRLESFQSKAMD